MYLTQSLHRAVQQSPDRVMTICGDRVRTTRQVADRVAALAGALRELGVQTGDRVGILSLNSDRFHELAFACWWLGAALHPLNIRWSAAEIAYAINDSGTELLLVDDTFTALVPQLQQRCTGLRTVLHGGEEDTPAGLLGYEAVIGGGCPVPDLRIGGDALALLLYTGGTTGAPKGVMASHDTMMTSLLGTAVAEVSSRRDGVSLFTAPLFHIAAILGWYEQFMVGGTGVFVPQFTAEGFLDAVQRHRVNSCILIPVMVQMICEHPDFESYDLSSLERIIYGGASSSEALLRHALATFPQARFSQGYGMTETGVLTMLGADEHRDPELRHARSVGRAVAHVELAVMDVDGTVLDAGQVGEVVTRGNHVMKGYWNKPEQTAQVVRDGWMHTGDGGYLDADGYLYIVDRLKDMIISGGENVYSAEVENALASHPGVAQCAVIGVPDEKWGERVHAVVVPRPGQAPTLEVLRAHTAELIAGYKCPRSLDLVKALPMTAAGKILKRRLRDSYVNS